MFSCFPVFVKGFKLKKFPGFSEVLISNFTRDQSPYGSDCACAIQRHRATLELIRLGPSLSSCSTTANTLGCLTNQGVVCRLFTITLELKTELITNEWIYIRFICKSNSSCCLVFHGQLTAVAIQGFFLEYQFDDRVSRLCRCWDPWARFLRVGCQCTRSKKGDGL